MNIVNATPFQFAPLAGRINFPKHSLTLIVKGTFDLMPGGTVVHAKEPSFPLGDQYYPDDIDMVGGSRYESDFAYYKPRADVLLAGHCHASGGKPVSACKVTFRVGTCSRSLYVFGDRYWKGLPGMKVISDPKPFTRMELRYENSFGGPGFDSNPVGKGFIKNHDTGNDTLLFLPNIEDPEHLIDAPWSRPIPAGFGPLGRMWRERALKLGTYTKNYRQERWPWFPQDFDWSHYNAAPPQLQYDGFLRGDEPLYFEHLHPEISRFTSRLPGIAPRCFLDRDSDDSRGGTVFSEVSMHLDTLWVDMDMQRVELVWRGSAEVSSDEYEDVRNVFIMSEPVNGPAASPQRCYELFRAMQAEEAAEWAMEPEMPPVAAAPEPAEADMKTPAGAAAAFTAKAGTVTAEEIPPELATGDTDSIGRDNVRDAEMPDPADIKAQAYAILAQGGIDLDALSPEVRQKVEGEMDSVINRMAGDDPSRVLQEQEAQLETQITETLAKLGIDRGKLPSLSEKARNEQMKLIEVLGFGTTYEEAIADGNSEEVNEMLSLMAAMLPKMGVDPENLDMLIEYARKQKDNDDNDNEE